MTERSLVPTQDTGISFGSSHLDAEDFIPPRVKVVQAQSAETENGVPEGDFFNTLTSQDYGPVLRFIPIGTFKNRILLVRKETRAAMNAALTTAGLPVIGENTDGLSCRSLDMEQGRGIPGTLCHECPLSAWRGADAALPPYCSETYNATAITDDGDLIILGFSKSSAKVGKRLFSMMRLTSGAPWRFQYEATTSKVKGEAGFYWLPAITKIAEPPAPELMKVAASFAQQLSGMVIDVTPEESAPADDGPAPWEEDAIGSPASA